MGLTDTPATLVLHAPVAAARVYDQAISIAGRLFSAAAPTVLRVFCEGICVGETRVFTRADAGNQGCFGFRLLGRFPEAISIEREATFEFFVGENAERAGELTLTVVPARLAERAYGDVVAPDRSDVLHRENIYGFGPPLENPGEEIARLILEYLPERSAVLDLGCGAGAYGPRLLAAGHSWLGAETNPLCWSILERRGLPFRRLELADRQLPFADGEFDAAIAIEVLEHVVELNALVAELARVTRDRFLVSVPNLEVIPYYAPLGVVPWHLLESTHVNFFTRASLSAVLAPHFAHVEVFTYAEPPVKSADSLPLHAHLFAVATR